MESNLELDRVPVGTARRICRPPERRGAGKGAPVLGAAKRTLAGEHRSGMPFKWRWAAERGHDRRDPVGGLRALSRLADELATPARLEGRKGFPKGKETVWFRSPLARCLLFRRPAFPRLRSGYGNGGGNGHPTLHRRSSRILAAFMRRAHSVSLIASACRSNSAKLKPGFRYCPARSSDCSFSKGV